MLPILVRLVCAVAFLLGGLANAQAQQRAAAKVNVKATGAAKVRSEKGFQRDQRRLKGVKATTDLASLLTSKSKLTGKLNDHASPWNAMKEGRAQFDLELGQGLKLEVGAGRYDLPQSIGGTQFKLHSLSLRHGERSHSLLPSDAPSVSLKSNTSYSYNRNLVSWRGPESRFSVLALVHELGHARDFGSASESQHREFSSVYDRVANNMTLSDAQHRQLVGLERSAWAHALRSARQLKKHGFDVFAGISPRELSSVIASSLKGYYEYQGTRP